MIKRKVILLGLSLVTAGSILANSNARLETTTPVSIETLEVKSNDADIKAVTETINTHLSGIKKGNIELIESAWLKSSASITEINNGKASNKDLDKSFALWAKEPTSNLNEKIISVQITSKNVAVAQISLLWNGSIYEDTLTLIKTNKGWKIISKIYNVPVVGKSKKPSKGGYGG